MDFITAKVLKQISLLTVLIVLLLFWGCTGTKDVSQDILNTPEHHIFSGFKLLKKGYLFHAKREFKLALQLDPHSWNAHRGLGLVYARENQFDRALSCMQQAETDAKSERAQALVDVGFMQVYLSRGAEGWFDTVRQRYARATSHDPSLPEALYYMGLAFKKRQRLTEARDAFTKVVEIDKALVLESQQELREIDRLQKGR